MVAGRTIQRALALVLALTLAAPFAAFGGAASLGTARGIRGVELSLDGGQRWLPLGARSLPILDGVQVRATTGGALLELGDGSRVNVLPFTSLRFRETGTGTEISLVYGRLTFRLPRDTRVEVRTPTARLTPVRKDAMAGEVFLGEDGTIGVRMTQGTLQVDELAGARRSLLASVEPVFLPKRPAQSGALFTSEAPAAPPAGARGVFSPRGESIGYLMPRGGLVVHPGYTADLTQPFAPRLVQLAMGKVPERDRTDAVPVFDVNGGYVGYLSGPVFYAQAVGVEPSTGAQASTSGVQVAQAPFGEAGLTTGQWVLIGGALVFVGGLSYGVSESTGGGGGGGTAATALRPRR